MKNIIGEKSLSIDIQTNNYCLSIVFILCFFVLLTRIAEQNKFILNKLFVLNFMNNALQVLFPYREEETWMFDDKSAGLVREPFVFGIPEMIDKMVEKIPNADKGFRLIFSDKPFPNFDIELDWRREESGGNWYYSSLLDSEGWLCPAMLKYFPIAPSKLFGKAEPKSS